MPINEESDIITTSDTDSLRKSLNSFYMSIIEGAKNLQNKFPLIDREKECSRDNLLCY